MGELVPKEEGSIDVRWEDVGDGQAVVVTRIERVGQRGAQ